MPLIRMLANGLHEARMTFVSPSGRTTRTGAELLDAAARVAAGLAERGVGRDARVVSQFPNCEEAVTGQLACLMLGAVFVPVVPTAGLADLTGVLRDARASALLTCDQWRSNAYARNIQLLPPNVRPTVTVVAGEARPSRTEAWKHLLRTKPLAEHQWTPRERDDVHLLIYTSGSTGTPKGVQHTGNSIVGETNMSYRVTGTDEDVYLQAAGAGHIGSYMYPVRMLRDGIRTFVLDAWDAVRAADLVAKKRVNSLPAVPMYLATLIEESDRAGLDISSIASSYVGGAPVMPRLVQAAWERGVVAQRTYGSSEQPTVAATQPDDSIQVRVASEGRPLGDNEIRIVDDRGRDVEVGSPGEMLTRGSELFVGYTNVPLTETFTQDGWFRTGDIGVWDTDGNLRVVDRRKNIIIRGGENLSASEIEAAVAEHPAVQDVAVIGVPDDRYGERVCAVVVLEDGETLHVPELVDHFAHLGLSRQKTPEYLQEVEELPRTATGKISRPQLRELVTGPR